MHDHDHEGAPDHEHGHDHDHEHHHHHTDDPAHMLEHFRAAKDAWFARDPHSPLSHEEQHHFQGLAYYPYNGALHMHLPLDGEVSNEPITMETSTGEQREYHRAGKIHFEVDGQPAELTIYADPDGELFLPLRDATSGQETYAAGRYLEPEPAGEGEVHVDFNYLYNPYCAYNEAYSCPLPPLENWLKVPLEAGEMNYIGAKEDGS
jgi:uncharacterized protein (DUF1684 family)